MSKTNTTKSEPFVIKGVKLQFPTFFKKTAYNNKSKKFVDDEEGK
jgi:hypothetical protein